MFTPIFTIFSVLSIEVMLFYALHLWDMCHNNIIHIRAIMVSEFNLYELFSIKKKINSVALFIIKHKQRRDSGVLV